MMRSNAGESCKVIWGHVLTGAKSRTKTSQLKKFNTVVLVYICKNMLM